MHAFVKFVKVMICCCWQWAYKQKDDIKLYKNLSGKKKDVMQLVSPVAAISRVSSKRPT